MVEQINEEIEEAVKRGQAIEHEIEELQKNLQYLQNQLQQKVGELNVARGELTALQRLKRRAELATESVEKKAAQPAFTSPVERAKLAEHYSEKSRVESRHPERYEEQFDGRH